MRKKLPIYSGMFFIFYFLLPNGNFQAQNDALFWEISGNGLKKKSYLFGTIHNYNTDSLKVPKEVYKKLKSSDCFIGELDLGKISGVDVSTMMYVENSDSYLNKLLDEEAFLKVMQYAPFNTMAEELAARMKPFWAMSCIIMSNDLEIEAGSVDKELYAFAQSNDKTIIGLETIEEQLSSIDAISLQEQAEMLKDYLISEETPTQSLNELTKAYKEQDFEKYKQEMSISSSSALNNELIEKRNKLMAERIHSFFSTGKKSAFIGIGALHLANIENIEGVVNLLKAKGYTLTPISLKF